MAYKRTFGWTKQAALTAGQFLVATDANTAEFSSAFSLRTFDQTVATNSGGIVIDVAGQLPAGALVLGVTSRVTIAITGCTRFAIGTAAQPECWGRSIGVAQGTTTTSAAFPGSGGITPAGDGQPVRLTAADGVFTDGALSLRTVYILLEAP